MKPRLRLLVSFLLAIAFMILIGFITSDAGPIKQYYFDKRDPMPVFVVWLETVENNPIYFLGTVGGMLTAAFLPYLFILQWTITFFLVWTLAVKVKKKKT